MKTRKSITKRFKVTKNGKVFRRISGLDHFRAKKSGKRVRQGRKWVKVADSEMRRIRKILF